jgi:hypothetical protein
MVLLRSDAIADTINLCCFALPAHARLYQFRQEKSP